tara:strand:+ start:205 stop:492 length:288 start_codon:yes stop_codon:yes gene_type:complete
MNKIVIIEKSELIELIETIVHKRNNAILEEVKKNQSLENTSKYYTRKEVAKLCKVHTQTIWEWCRKGILKEPETIGRRVLFLKKDVHNAIENLNS